MVYWSKILTAILVIFGVMNMSACTFFGHWHVLNNIEAALQSTIIDLIENHGVDCFYIGNHGSFDSLVRKTLDKLSKQYSFRYTVVLAYLPQENQVLNDENSVHTLLPDGIEFVPRRFAISWRNKWMIEQSDYVVTYINYTIGSGAAQFSRLAERKNKIVIHLGEM